MFDRVMSRFGIRGKIFVLLGLFLVPLVLLGVSLLEQLSAEKEVADSELAGVLHIRTIYTDTIKSGRSETFAVAKKKIFEIANDSKLVLDPQFDTYYLQSILTNDLVELAEHVIIGNSDLDEHSRIENRGVLELNVLPRLFENFSNAKLTTNTAFSKRSNLSQDLAGLSANEAIYREAILAAFDGSQLSLHNALNVLGGVSTQLSSHLESMLEERSDRLASKLRSAWIVTGSTFLVLLLLSWSIIRNITGRLGYLFLATRKAADHGDLTQSVSEEGADEIFELSRSFNGMISSLRGMVKKVVHSGTIISTSTSEIAAVSKQQQATTSEIAATTTQIEATSKQIALTSTQLSNSMHEVQEIADDTATLAANGQEGLTKMSKTMQGITDACAGISQKLENLSLRAARIGDVVVTIAKVADQTNLLSLNAAIEAEKAGEYGHGFAVVAREIRRLADQTAASTVDIDRMVKEIQGAVAAGVMGMEKFGSEVRRGAEEVESTGTQFKTIISQVQALTPTFQAVADGMHSQALGAKQITESLTQLSTAARQTADSLSQSNSSIEQLHKAALMMETEVAKFQLGEGH